MKRHATTLRLSAAAAVLAATVSGCASVPPESDTAARAAYDRANDPIEPLNRYIGDINYALDQLVLKPIAGGYREIMPKPVQSSVRSVLRNLRSPVVLANDLAQGEWDRAGDTAMRFLINSTVGIAGLFDVAKDMGYPHHDEDFGQTLAVAGVDEGPYIVLPVLGPSNPRDTVGLVVDWLIDPFRAYAASHHEWETAQTVRTGLTVVDTREAVFEPLEEIEKSSVDYYAALRTMYRQRRAAEIRNGAPAAEGISGEAFDEEPAK